MSGWLAQGQAQGRIAPASSIGSMPAKIKMCVRSLTTCLFRVVGSLFFMGGRFYRGWAGSIWREEHETRSLLINPAIPNVDRDAKSVGEIAGSAG